MNKTKNIREVILEILLRIEKHNSYLNILLQHYFNSYYFKSEDKALLQEITYGVIRFRQKIDWIIKHFLILRNKKLPIEINNILRIGVYQLFYLDKIPHYAVVNESVQLVKKIKKYEYANLVNAVLRNVIREKDQLKWPADMKGNIEDISIFYSFPAWLIKRWISRFGEKLCIQICETMNKKPKITIRSNPIRADLDLLKRELEKLGIAFQESQYLSKELLTLENIINIADSDIFKKGFFSVQDESSALASRFLAPLPGETILDMCSGPGGKTTHIAQ
ncbi:MAG: transcription antitermination factor NusB, partial [Atribacterota bacterium]|nr:transcription antitermination factor NusB [Atribacterota bacterium]